MTAVVVLNWNGLAATRRCLASLVGQGAEVWVVDNGSTDGSAEALAQEPGVRFLGLSANLGFGAGMNRGIEASGASRVLLLNNDAVLGEGAIARLEAALDADPGLAAAVPTIYRGAPPDRTRLWAAGGRLGRWTGVVRAGRGEVTFASGCCLLLRREAWAAVGGLSEDYFLYFEDVELSHRLLAAGWRLALVPEAEAWHENGASTGSQRVKAAALDYYDVRNGLVFIRRRFEGLPRATALAYFWAVRLPRKLVRILLSPHRRAALAAVQQALTDSHGEHLGPYQAGEAGGRGVGGGDRAGT